MSACAEERSYQHRPRLTRINEEILHTLDTCEALSRFEQVVLLGNNGQTV